MGGAVWRGRGELGSTPFFFSICRTTLEGGESHKNVGQGENRLLQLYYGHKVGVGWGGGLLWGWGGRMWGRGGSYGAVSADMGAAMGQERVNVG